MKDFPAVPVDIFFDLHERLDQTLGLGFSVRVEQQMKMDDYGGLGLSWKTCSKAGEIFERCERYFQLLSNTYVFRDVELISVGIRRSNFGFSRVKKIKHSRATVHFFEEESIQKNKSKPGIYYFHVP